MMLAGVTTMMMMMLLQLLWSVEVQSLTHFECEGNQLYFACGGVVPTVLMIRSAVYGRQHGVGYR